MLSKTTQEKIDQIEGTRGGNKFATASLIFGALPIVSLLAMINFGHYMFSKGVTGKEGYGQMLIWLAAIASPLAIIIGATALNQIKKLGGGGKGQAVTGIVLGVLGLPLTFFIFVLAVLSSV